MEGSRIVGFHTAKGGMSDEPLVIPCRVMDASREKTQDRQVRKVLKQEFGE